MANPAKSNHRKNKLQYEVQSQVNVNCPLPGNHALTNAWLLLDESPRSTLKTHGNNKKHFKKTDVLSSNSQCRKNCGLSEKSATAASWKLSWPSSSSVAPCNKSNGSATINLPVKHKLGKFTLFNSMLFMTDKCPTSYSMGRNQEQWAPSSVCTVLQQSAPAWNPSAQS